MNKNYVIRTIYLYLFALVGLTLMIIAGVRLINLGLKVYVFTQIERQENVYQKMPPSGVISPEKAGELNVATGTVQLTSAEQEQVKSWLADYQRWQEEQKSYNPVLASRQRVASECLAMLIIGLPLFLFHWGIIRKENKEKKENIVQI